MGKYLIKGGGNAMLRDMEDLLNKVYDKEVKAYLKESLKCYMSESYRACVIMSVIAGVFDLHIKVKALAGGNKNFKELDENVEQKKKDLIPYEKYLIEQCATEEIDMLNKNEAKELIRCLDTRNDCAHPSNFICSPEKARDIFSTVIDILASKPVLFGCQHMKMVVEKMNEKSFFPVLEKEKMKLIVQETLKQFQTKAIEPFLKLLGTTIKNSQSEIQKKNVIRFLALSTEFVSEIYENCISEFIEKDKYENELLALLEININILNILSDVNIEKIISKIVANLDASEINNIEVWIEIILSDKLKGDKYINKLVEKITAFKVSQKDARYLLLHKILKSEKCSEKYKEIIKINCGKEFTLFHYEETCLTKIIILLNDNLLYQHWIDVITRNISSYDFNIGNRAVYVLRLIEKEYWLDKVSYESKVSLVERILYEGTKTGYYSHSCSELMYNLNYSYPELTEIFLEYIFGGQKCDIENEEIKKYFTPRYAYIISKYILSYEKMSERIIEKLINLRNSIEIECIINELKNRIEELEDEHKKNMLLAKFEN